MKRPTIAEVAKVAGVSISTVDRVLNRRAPVRPGTSGHVLQVAQQLGYAVEDAKSATEHRSSAKLGYLLLQSHRPFYQDIAQGLRAEARQWSDRSVQVQIEFADDLAPEAVAHQLLCLGKEVDAVGLIAAEYPEVVQAIETLHADGVPICALVSNLSAKCSVGYVGLDNRKVGRTAAWSLAHLCRGDSRKVGFVIGSHRYRCQELNEIGFRSYFRELAPSFRVLEPVNTLEDISRAELVTRELLQQNPDLSGLYIAGGGLLGALKALREAEHSPELIVVGHEMMEATRSALLEGTLTVVLSHPMQSFLREGIATLLEAMETPRDAMLPLKRLPFEIYVSENL